jgi:glycosyltransferase involved in cell wall biosynthesis
MIRVGFLVQYDVRGWTGGVNYLSNLFLAIRSLDDSGLEPVVFTGLALNPGLETHFPGIQVVRSSWLDGAGLRGILRRSGARLVGLSIGLRGLLSRHRIDVLSHSGDPGRGLGIPAIGWIADFQHLHVPDFFSEKELAERNAVIRRVMAHCDIVLVSSHDAAADFARFAPSAIRKARVLQFVAAPPDPARLPELATLREQYGFSEPYFHLPNQFWAHKNHRVVIDALAELAQGRLPPLVLATGSTADYRNPGHFDSLMGHARRMGVGDRFRVLGLVPFDHLGALMRHSIAVINPSLFEGWSTTVEESKSVGKLVILSDIAVHREQAPERALYFPATDAKGLSERMLDARAAYDEPEEAFHERRARERWPGRLAAFGAGYQAVVNEIMNGTTRGVS